MRAFASLFVVFIYWVIDGYYNANSMNISFGDALSYNIIVKIVISLGIIALAFIPYKQKIAVPAEEEDVELTIFKKVSQIITSPIPVVTQTNQIAQVLQEKLGVKCSFICEYLNDEILVLNTRDNLKLFGVKNKYNKHSEGMEEDSIEGVLTKFYLEKREYLEEKVTTPQGEFTIYINALTKEGDSKAFGAFVILSDSEHECSHIIKGLSALIAFSILLHQKKVAFEKFQNHLAQKDDKLNIPTNTVLQTLIEQEYHRYLRYGTSLTLILIEIDHIKNLKSIFDSESILNMKKEFSKLMQKNVRTTDTFGKWTENRFAIVAPTIDFRAGRNFASKLTRVLIENRFSKVGKITCSFGVASLANEENIIEFRKRAEEALNLAIQKGGNCTEVHLLI